MLKKRKYLLILKLKIKLLIANRIPYWIIRIHCNNNENKPQETIITFTNDALPATFFQVYKIINLRL